MTPDQYVEAVLAKYQVPRGPMSAAEQFGAAVSGPLRTWANRFLNDLSYSGSYAKETGVHGTSDVDVFISLISDTPGTLKDIHNSLHAFAQEQRWAPRHQNVSIGVTVNGTLGDLVPGTVQAGYQNYHSLYSRKRDSWMQTNVALHVKTVRDAQRSREIRAIKIWRKLNDLDFPSLYLELFVIRTLMGRSTYSLADNVFFTLKTIGASFVATRIEDPANSNNVLSDDLTKQEREKIARIATTSSQENSWERIIW